MGKNALDIIKEPLTDMEIEVLRILNDEDVPGWTWGAAMAVCCENLKALGYAEGMYEISYKGKDFLYEQRRKADG